MRRLASNKLRTRDLTFFNISRRIDKVLKHDDLLTIKQGINYPLFRKVTNVYLKKVYDDLKIQFK